MDFIKFFVKNYQFTLVVFIALMLLGVNSLMNMPRSEDPPFRAPIYTVVVIYPGTSPEDMETLVADLIEKELYQLDNIKQIKTIIDDGLMFMLVEFNYGVDTKSKYNDVIREVNKLRTLPKDILKIDIKQASASDVAILQTAIISETATMVELEDQAELIKKKLERIPAIKWVEIQAIPTRSIRIELDLDKMAVYELGLNQVLGLIQANNVNIPGGAIKMGNRKFNINTSAEYESIEDIKRTVVNTTKTGQITKLSDIASVFETDEENAHIARYDGKRAIWVVSAMKDNENIVKTKALMEPMLEEFKANLPDYIHVAQAFDQEVMVSKRLRSLGIDFMIAVFLVLLTLLPLGTRASFVVMISIPLSLSIGLFLLDILGFTLNQMSIVGMVIALGLLVDDSIVVVENIERYMRVGMPAKQASITATNHILVAIFGCTATLLLAFLPLANLPEAAGDFIKALPVAVMTTVIASLFVSLTIIPFLSSMILKPHGNSNGNGNAIFRAFKTYVNDPYQRLLGWSIKHPAMTLVIAALIFGSSLLLIPKLGFSLFPASEKPMFAIEVETELGSNIDHTNRIVHEIEQRLLTNKDIEGFATNIGKGNPRIFYNEFQPQQSASTAQIMVFLDTDIEVPHIIKVTEDLRQEFSDFVGAKIEIRRFQQGEPVSAPIEMRIVGNNLDTLKSISAKVEHILETTDGTIYVKNPISSDKTELKIKIDRDKAGLFGLTTKEIALTIRLAISGLDISKFRQENKDESNLKVTVSNHSHNAIDVFNKIQITSFSGSLIPLKSIASITLQKSASIIRHFNKERYSLVSCFSSSGKNIDALTSTILDRIDKEVVLPKNYSIVAAGEREARKKTFGGMTTVVMLAIFGLLAILILEFRTFKSTFIVLSVLPLGLVGAFLALWFAGETLSFVAMVGVIALAGIEIKNSILMVDYTNGLREQGMPLFDAVMDGAETRFLPILLTTLTAIGGMTPLVLERSPLISPLAIVLIGGLISSLLLSRIVTPVLYYLIPPKVVPKS